VLLGMSHHLLALFRFLISSQKQVFRTKREYFLLDNIVRYQQEKMTARTSSKRDSPSMASMEELHSSDSVEVKDEEKTIPFLR
jgi:hypothetical protein